MRRALMALSGIIILITAATSFAGICVCGDVNNNGIVNIQDVTYLTNFLYKGGSAPFFGPVCADANGDGIVNIQDITYLINFLYEGGPAPLCAEVTDIDGNVYKAVKIGNQWWMAENLKVTHYRNGNAIPNVTGNTAWEALTTGAYCEYNNNIANVAVYGRLYNWFAVTDSSNIAPAGWHVPSITEWQTLVDTLGGNAVAGGKMKEAGTTHWGSPNTGATNESGFTGLPGSERMYEGSYWGMGAAAFFWSSSAGDWGDAWSRVLWYNDSTADGGEGDGQFGYSIRCVKD